MKNSSKLDSILYKAQLGAIGLGAEPLSSKENAKRQIKKLMLEMIGDDDQVPENAKLVLQLHELERNQLRAEQRAKLEDL